MNIEVNTPNPIELKQQMINEWLRYHTDYKVMIDLCDLYGVVSIKITCNNEYVKSWWGTHLEERLDEVIAFLKIDEWRKHERLQ